MRPWLRLPNRQPSVRHYPSARRGPFPSVSSACGFAVVSQWRHRRAAAGCPGVARLPVRILRTAFLFADRPKGPDPGGPQRQPPGACGRQLAAVASELEPWIAVQYAAWLRGLVLGRSIRCADGLRHGEGQEHDVRKPDTDQDRPGDCDPADDPANGHTHVGSLARSGTVDRRDLCL